MEEIKLYLEGAIPDFAQGYALFCKYSRNQSLMAYIGRKKDMDMLLYNLKKMLTEGVQINPLFEANLARFGRGVDMILKSECVQDNAGKEVIELDKEKLKKQWADLFDYAKRYKREELPEELVPLFDKNACMYKELRAIHEKMKQCNSDVGRAEFRTQILSQIMDINKRWELITNKANEFHSDDNGSNEITFTQLNSARSYISKMVNKDKITDEQRLKVIEYYKILVDNKAAINDKTIAKLKEKGFIS